MTITHGDPEGGGGRASEPLKITKNIRLFRKKEVSMIRKYHNHTLQTYPRHREEEPKNLYSNTTYVRQ